MSLFRGIVSVTGCVAAAVNAQRSLGCLLQSQTRVAQHPHPVRGELGLQP